MRKIHTFFEVTVSPMISDKLIENDIYTKIQNGYNPKPTDSTNVLLIEMEHFKPFLKEFHNTQYINWNSISSSKYYDWDLECLSIGKNVLDWNELIENKTTRNLIKSNNFPQELNKYLEEYDYLMDIYENEEEWESIFFIKEYEGVLRDYFELERVFESQINNNFPKIKNIEWLSSYSTPFDIMNKERLKFDLSEFDYVFAFEIDTKKEGSNSNIAMKMALEQNLEIYYDLNELKKNASC